MANFTEQPEQRNQVKMSIMQKKKRKIYSYVLLIIFGLIIVWVLQGIYLPTRGDKYTKYTPGVVITIEQGDGLMDIASKLKQANVIRSKYSFAVYVALADKQSDLKAGTYLFFLQEGMNIPRAMTALVDGQIAKKELIVIEGWNLRDIAWWFENQGMFQTEELFEIVGFPAVDQTKAQDLPLVKDFSE